ncbi:hypothetical protein GY45DRAFT_1375105 [Cubamyces sp. BRFM 1775]|nr:hypothetical protein GY45DRAFT_1375105 [Cubamyces sp. BRFM 1775]
MPELDILHGFEYQTLRAIKQWERLRGRPFNARIQLFPRVFALGTKNKPYTTCTVEQSELFNYTEDLEPPPADYQPAPQDIVRSKGKPYEPYLKPLHTGALQVKVRGKEIVFAAGYHALRVHFGLEGTIIMVPTTAYEKMVQTDCPGNSKEKHRADRMRSFVVPPELTVPGARPLPKSSQQTIAIFAAIVGEEETIIVVDHNRLTRLNVMSLNRPWCSADLQPDSQLWPSLWSANHGPDWIYEADLARAMVDVWRRATLAIDTSCIPELLELLPATLKLSMDDLCALVTKAQRASSILAALVSIQEAFNGYGQHTATDLLHSLVIWPGMPPREVCADEQMYAALRAGLSVYASQYVSAEFRTRCLSIPNHTAALTFNYKSDINYINQYLHVYRKCTVRMRADLYNKYAMVGLFDTKHVIGAPYVAHQSQLAFVQYKRDVPVYEYKSGSTTLYSVIRAARPLEWIGAESVPAVPSDVRDAGFATTIGPASFHAFKQNQYDWQSVATKGGRKRMERTGKPGRPAKARPSRGELRRRSQHGNHVVQVSKAKLETMESDSDGIKPPRKRVRLAKMAELPSSDRVTRSGCCAEVEM